jgi:type IV pilus assembly protein PilV
MVAIAVFALGAIGVAVLQSVSTQYSYESMQRTQAAYLASDILERMRNNRVQLNAYDDNADDLWTIVGSGSIMTPPTPDCASVACTASQLAAYDLWNWEQAIDGASTTQPGGDNVGGLANATGCIRHTGNGRVELAIAWLGRSELNNATLATGCTVNKRYGDENRHRRVLLVQTYIAGRGP